MFKSIEKIFKTRKENWIEETRIIYQKNMTIYSVLFFTMFKELIPKEYNI